MENMRALIKLDMDATLFAKYQTPVKSRATERGELIRIMTEAINEERKGTKYKPLTLRAIAVKIGHIETKDLYYLLSICKAEKLRGGSFGKVFFGSIKVK